MNDRMPDRTDVEDLLSSMLRGTAKLIGCTSANLLVFNEKTRELTLRVVCFAESNPALAELEDSVGLLRGARFDFDLISDSLAIRAWRDRVVLETTSLTELAGSAFPAEMQATFDQIIGEHRFAMVPVVTGRRRYGLVVFEKPGHAPFSPQQRNLMVRYTRRMTELIENELRDRGAELLGPIPGDSIARLFVDREGRVAGGTQPSLPDLALPSRWAERAAERAARFLRDGEVPAPHDTFPNSRVVADYARIEVRGEELALVTLSEEAPQADLAGHQLVQIALGDAAPAVICDADLRITSINGAAERLFGYAAGDLIGRSVRDLFHEPRQMHVILDHQLLVLASGHYEEAAVLRRRDGSVFSTRVESLLLADDSDHVIGLLILIRERAEEEDDDDAARLAHRERLANMGELAGQLAHEIRNPLVAVGATLEGLRRDLDEGRDVRPQVDQLCGQVARVDRILKEYLSLAGRSQGRARPVDLGDLARDAARLVLSASPHSRHRIDCRVPEGLTVVGDLEALRHLFCNLFQNAVEAMPGGGVVRCDARAGAGVVSVQVDDRGPGLTCELDQAFRPFFTTKKSGTGLGLTVCQKVVAAHGGTLDLKNRKGGGCRATVVLPRKVIP